MNLQKEIFLLKAAIEDTTRGYEKQIEEAFSRPDEDKDKEKLISGSQEMVKEICKVKEEINCK